MEYFYKTCQILGYTPHTEMYQELTAAELKGNSAIEKLANDLIDKYKNDKVNGTELTIFLNWKTWECAKDDIPRAKIYQKLWKKIDNYIVNNWNKDDLSYFLKETD